MLIVLTEKAQQLLGIQDHVIRVEPITNEEGIQVLDISLPHNTYRVIKDEDNQ